MLQKCDVNHNNRVMSDIPTKSLADDKELRKQLHEAVLFRIDAEKQLSPSVIVDDAIQTILEMIDSYYRLEVASQDVKLFKLLDLVYPNRNHLYFCFQRSGSVFGEGGCGCGWTKVSKTFAKELL